MPITDPTLSVFKDPTTGQEVVFGDADLNKEQIQSRGLVYTSGPKPRFLTDAPQSPLGGGTPVVSRDASLGDEFIDTSGGAGKVDEAKIREERRQAAQSVIAVQQELFNRLAGQIGETQGKKLAEQRGINVRSGLSGSSFVPQANEEINVKARQAIESLERERSAVISNILAQADASAVTEIRAQRAEKLGELEAVTKAREFNLTKATQIAKALGAQSMTAEELRTKDPNRYQSLVNQFGDELSLKAAILSGVPEGKMMFKENLGGGKVGFVIQTPTGFSKEIIDFGAIGEQLNETDDVEFNKQTGQAVIFTYDKPKGEPGAKLISTRVVDTGAVKELQDAGLTPKQTSVAIQLSNSLKSHPAYVDMLDIYTGVQGVRTGLAQANGFGDITAINAFQRMVDPGATVRSEDVVLLQSASAFVQKILSDYPIEKLTKGAKLPDEVRKTMQKTAEELYKVRAETYNDMVGKQYRNLSESNKIPFEFVGQEFPLSGGKSEKAPEDADIGEEFVFNGQKLRKISETDFEVIE